MAKIKKYDSLIYQTKSGAIEIKGDLEKETIWLSQLQISEIFDISVANTSRHIKNIFKDGEIPKKSNLHFLQIANSDKPTAFYSLDVVLAVGYRTNSSKAIAFRKWSTQIIKSYLSKGYALNEKRLQKAQKHLLNLQNAIEHIQEKVQPSTLTNHANEMLSLFSVYSKSLTHLLQYDKKSLTQPEGTTKSFSLDYDIAKNVISKLKNELIAKKEASNLFGLERQNGFVSIIKSIDQSFGGVELYPTVESKAAHLFYLIIKNHPFSDGNKRIGSFMLVYYLEKTKCLHHKNGELKINTSALTALALLVAESDPQDKDLMIVLIMNLVA